MLLAVEASGLEVGDGAEVDEVLLGLVLQNVEPMIATDGPDDSLPLPVVSNESETGTGEAYGLNPVHLP